MIKKVAKDKTIRTRGRRNNGDLNKTLMKITMNIYSEGFFGHSLVANCLTKTSNSPI